MAVACLTRTTGPTVPFEVAFIHSLKACWNAWHISVVYMSARTLLISARSEALRHSRNATLFRRNNLDLGACTCIAAYIWRPLHDATFKRATPAVRSDASGRALASIVPRFDTRLGTDRSIMSIKCQAHCQPLISLPSRIPFSTSISAIEF